MTCKKSTELTSRELDADLSGLQRFALGFHCLLCGNCRRFRSQLGQLDRAAGELLAGEPPDGEPMPDDAKERVRAKLFEEIGQN